jgi:uncharacterized repeat protein (TIGR03803 family)
VIRTMSLSRWKAIAALAVAAGVLSACGGGGGSGGGPSTYSVGGTISGLTEAGLVLADNGGDKLPVTANAATFTFSTPISSGGTYTVTIATQPTGQTCTVTSGAGTVNAKVTSVSVACVLQTFTLGGTVTGLSGSANLVLVNGTNSVMVPGNGGFSFSVPVPYGGSYAITVDTQPAAQTCTVTNGAGSAVSANVSGVSVACTPATESVLHSFGGPPDGAGPVQLIQARDGNFYGTTSFGGDVGFYFGTVFKITPAGVETILYSFYQGVDGGQPAGLIQGADGNFYGTTTYGGAPGNVNSANPGKGVVFKLTPTGTETVLYAFQGGTDGANPGALIQGSDGNFYGMTGRGGTAGYGTVFKITPAGVETVLHSFQGGADGVSPAAGAALLQASDGNFYGTTPTGGANSCGSINNGCGIVFRITPSGDESVLYSFKGGVDGSSPQSPLIQGGDGDFYSTTVEGGTAGFGTVFKITPAGVETVLHTFPGGADGFYPGPLLQASDGNLYGTAGGGAFNFGTIFQLTPAGVISPQYSFQGNPNPAGAPDGANPLSLILGRDGVFYGVTVIGGAANGGTVFKF